MKKSLKQLGLGEANEKLLVAQKEQTVISIMGEMNRSNISAVPVVDENGKIIGNFSASNLKDVSKYR